MRGLDELVSSGDVSDDESIAVLASEFTRVELADLESEEDVEASTILEMVDRARTEQGSILQPELDAERRKREDIERAATISKGHTAAIVSNVEEQVLRRAAVSAQMAYGSICAIPILGGFLTLSTNWSRSVQADAPIVWWLCAGAFMVCSVLAFIAPRLQLFQRV